MPYAPSITFLCAASRISNGGTMAPPGSASILRLPPVSLSTRSAKNLSASCVVLDGGTADCIFSVLGCWASAGPANASETETATARAALLGEIIFIARQSFFELEVSQQGLARERQGCLGQDSRRCETVKQYF